MTHAHLSHFNLVMHDIWHDISHIVNAADMQPDDVRISTVAAIDDERSLQMSLPDLIPMFETASNRSYVSRDSSWGGADVSAVQWPQQDQHEELIRLCAFEKASECHLCNGDGVLAIRDHPNRCFVTMGCSTYSTNVTILNRVYVRSVGLCQKCIELDGGTFAHTFLVESAKMAAMYTSIFAKLEIPKEVAAKIVECLFEERHGRDDNDSDVDIMPALVAHY